MVDLTPGGEITQGGIEVGPDERNQGFWGKMGFRFAVNNKQNQTRPQFVQPSLSKSNESEPMLFGFTEIVPKQFHANGTPVTKNPVEMSKSELLNFVQGYRTNCFADLKGKDLTDVADYKRFEKSISDRGVSWKPFREKDEIPAAELIVSSSADAPTGHDGPSVTAQQRRSA